MAKASPKTAEEILIMAENGHILREILREIQTQCETGTKTLKELDTLAEQMIRDAGGVPAFKGYHGYPYTLCTMRNNEVVHAFPTDSIPEHGDILTIDSGFHRKGFCADSAVAFIMGGTAANKARARFLKTCYEALDAGCAAAIAGNHVGDIGYAIEKTLIRGGYDVCREYTGHGIGRTMHEDPHIYNFGKKGHGPALYLGQTIAIEPIAAMRSGRTKVLADGWTVVTADGHDACQVETFGVITETGFQRFFSAD